MGLSIDGIKTKTEQVFGTHKKTDDVGEKWDKATTQENGEAVITLAGLQQLYGLSKEQIAGLQDVYGVTISEKELGDINVEKESAKKTFHKIFSGTQKTDKEINGLFEELWLSASQGTLTNGRWDELMKKYGLDEMAMTGAAFTALMGGQDGFSSDNVDGFAEFVIALNNMELTLNLYAGNEKQFSAALQNLCDRTNFRVIKLGEFEKLTIEALKQIKPKYDYSKTMADIFKAIEDGEFGEELQNLVKYNGVKNWQELLVKLVAKMRKSVEAGINGNSEVDTVLTLNRRMKVLIDIVNGKDADVDKRKALVGEMAGVLQDKSYFNFETVEDGGKKKADGFVEADYDGVGGLTYIWREIEKARKNKEKKEPDKPEAEGGS